MKVLRTAALASLTALAGCATITRGSTQAFTVETVPSGARVATSLGERCDATPCTFAKVERDSNFTVTVSRPGYRTTTHTVTHETAGAGAAGMAGNVLLGGIVGGFVDASTGATQNLVPNPLRITMDVDTATASAGKSVPVAVTPPPVTPAVVAPAPVAPAPIIPAIAPAPVTAPAVSPVAVSRAADPPPDPAAPLAADKPTP